MHVQESRYFLAALRRHWAPIAALVLVAIVVAGAYSVIAEKRFEASADLLVSPVAAGDPTFVGISVIRDSDQARGVLTVARLVRSPATADRVVDVIRGGLTRQDVIDAVTVTPQTQSNILTITAEASTSRGAVRLANTVAAQLIRLRTLDFQAQIDGTIQRMDGALAGIPEAERASPQALELSTRVGLLRGLVGAPDPTVRLASPAVEPLGPVWPRPKIAVAAAAVVALLLGIGAVLAYAIVNPTIATEDELLGAHRLPVLARVPLLAEEALSAPVPARGPLPRGAIEAYRALRANISGAGSVGGMPRTILVVSANEGEGKTTTAMNLALTTATAGFKVVLVDGDLRNPSLQVLFGITGRRVGFSRCLLDAGTSPEEALIAAPSSNGQLQVLVAGAEHVGTVDYMQVEQVERVLTDLALASDVVIFDSSALTEVADALVLADAVDVVVVAVRLGRTRRDRLAELRRLLAQRGISPIGFVVTAGQSRRLPRAADTRPRRSRTAEEQGRRRSEMTDERELARVTQPARPFD